MFRNDKDTVFYCFGYTETFQSESTQNVVKSYIHRNQFNILVLDWENYSGGNYVTEAVPNMFKVFLLKYPNLFHSKFTVQFYR